MKKKKTIPMENMKNDAATSSKFDGSSLSVMVLLAMLDDLFEKKNSDRIIGAIANYLRVQISLPATFSFHSCHPNIDIQERQAITWKDVRYDDNFQYALYAVGREE